jgi:hypothetical protein
MRGGRAEAGRRWCLVALVVLAGCATQEGGGGARTRVPVTDIKTVVGRWEGLLSGLSARPSADQDLVDVVIRGDATYEAKAFRTIGVLQGRGTIELQNGALVLRGQGGSAGTAQLFAVDGRRVIEVETTTADGRRVTARLSPRS